MDLNEGNDDEEEWPPFRKVNRSNHQRVKGREKLKKCATPFAVVTVHAAIKIV